MQGKITVSRRFPSLETKGCGLHASQGSTQSYFSLSEEARNTERHHSWSPDLKLRHSRISFVSAGTSTAEDLNSVLQECETSDEATKSSFQAENGAPAKAFGNLPTVCTVTPDAQMSNMTLKDLKSTLVPRVNSEVELDSIYERSSVDRCLNNAEASTEAPLIFHKGANKPLHTDLMTPTVGRAASPTGSASSGEFIIFAGRQPLRRKSDQTYASDAGSRNLNASNMSKPSGNGSSIPNVVENPINATAQGVQTSPIYRPSSFLPLDPEKASVDLSCQSKVTVTRSGRRRRRKRLGEKAKDEGILDDYVANLREGGALKDLVEGSVLNQRDLGSSDTAEWQAESEPPTRVYVENNSMMDSDEWNSAEEDYDELGTSIEALRSARNVLSKRQRPSGVQYLVVEAGCTAEKARWFPASSLDIQGAETSIREFENNAELDHLLNDSDSSDGRSTIDEQVARDLQDDFNEQEDEQYLEERRKARMNDEQMARLLLKQDELGLRSDGLILFDGGDVEINSQDELQLDGQWERAVTHRMSKRKGQSGFNFPSATAFANVLDRDPYNSSGVMDTQRSSLSKRPKGRRGKLSLELSDSELEYSIRTAWEKDRAKKKLRKEEREELRAQGLLDKKPKKDLKAKYSGGISMTHVKEEIRDFLLSSMERYVSRSLPLLISFHGNLVCRFRQWLGENAKWCMKSPTSSN